MATELLILLVSIIFCMFLVWFFSHRSNHRERMLRLEKGLPLEGEAAKSRFGWLRLGLLVTGLGVGLLIISLLVALDMLEKGGSLLPLAILGVSGGASMVIANRIEQGKKGS